MTKAATSAHHLTVATILMVAIVGCTKEGVQPGGETSDPCVEEYGEAYCKDPNNPSFLQHMLEVLQQLKASPPQTVPESDPQ